jgi:O-antigen/teichoic acid export membrane protein
VLVCQALAAIAMLASLHWLGVYVDPETFGRYALYQSVISAGALLLISWPNAALLRFGREEWGTHRRIGATLAARLTLFASCLCVAVGLSWLLDPWLRAFLRVEASPFVWIAAGVILMPTAELAVYTNQAVGRTEMYGYSPLITRAGFLAGVLLIPAFRPGADWTYLAVCILTATAIAASFAVVTLPLSHYGGFGFDAGRVGQLLRYSWTLPFAGISTYVVNWIDSWVIRDVKGVASVGVYNFAYQTTAVAALAFAPIAVVLTPRVIDARVNGDRLSLQRYVDAIVPTVSLFAAAVAFSLAFVFPLLRRVAAPAYEPAYPVILILASALPFQLIAYLVTPIGNAYERILPRFVLVSAVIAVLNTTGDLLLVRRIGINGAAIATTSSFAIGALLQVVVVQRAGLDFGPLWRFATPALVVAPALAVLGSNGPTTGGAVIVAATAAAIVAALTYFGRSGDGVISRVLGLGRALTLAGAEAGPTVTPPAEQMPDRC